jgi:hypothetical protein
MSHIGTSDMMLGAGQRDGPVVSPRAFSTCELDLEIIALSILDIHPDGVESPPGFLFGLVSLPVFNSRWYNRK